MNAIKNITIGHTERLYKPVGFTMLANLINIVPFCLSIEAVRIIFSAFDGSGLPLDTTRLWCIFGIMAVYMLAMALAERASYRANFRRAYEMSASGRLSLAEHLRKLSLGFLSRRDPGDLSSMLITDFMMAETGISHHLPQLMGAVVMPVLAFASLVWIDWRMAVSMFAALPLAILVLWASTGVQRTLSGKQIQAKINAGNRLEEYLQGIRVMKAYNLLGDRFVRLRDAFAELRRACIRQEALLGPFVLLSITIVRAGLTMMVLCGTYLLLGGELSILVFVLFLVVGSRVFDPLTSALTNFTEFRYFSIAGGRILTLMNEPEMKGEQQSPMAGEIRFEHVSFAYDPQKPLMKDIDLHVKAGSKVAVVGKTGAGKTTLVNLLMRFYDISSGCIRVDGHDINTVTRDSLRSSFGMVLQDTYLFEGTIAENIAYGKPDASREAIIAAAKKSGAHEFIIRLNKGYDTVLHGNSSILSQGQRQLLSITRVLLMNPRVLILDEATSSIDTVSEQHVNHAMHLLMEGKTSFIIAHRLSTIIDADLILVMEQGNIIEQGTHEELLNKNGAYAQLFNSQFA